MGWIAQQWRFDLRHRLNYLKVKMIENQVDGIGGARVHAVVEAPGR